MTPDEAAASLWNWSLEVYADPQVKEALLALQDRYFMNANLVLWSIWAARSGWSFSPDQVRELAGSVDDFATHGAERLREIRRYLSGPKPGFETETLAPLRKEVLAAELHAEHLIQNRLACMTIALGGDPAPSPVEGGDGFAWAHFNHLPLRLEKPLILGDEQGPGTKSALFDNLLQAIAGKEPE